MWRHNMLLPLVGLKSTGRSSTWAHSCCTSFFVGGRRGHSRVASFHWRRPLLGSGESTTRPQIFGGEEDLGLRTLRRSIAATGTKAQSKNGLSHYNSRTGWYTCSFSEGKRKLTTLHSRLVRPIVCEITMESVLPAPSCVWVDVAGTRKICLPH